MEGKVRTSEARDEDSGNHGNRPSRFLDPVHDQLDHETIAARGWWRKTS